MTQPSYLRFPHLYGELITFTAEDDVWAAQLDGGRAWRVSADNTPVSHPRISPDGRHIAWTSTRDGAPEVHLAPVDGGPSKRLTHWGNRTTAVRGWLPGAGESAPGEVLAISAHGRPSQRHTWAWAVPLDGSPARMLPYGPVGDVACQGREEPRNGHEGPQDPLQGTGDERRQPAGPDGAVLLLSASIGREAAAWKRYRGGTAGKLWLSRGEAGEAGEREFERLHADLDGNLECPMWVGERVAFLSDHEGVGALYSSLPDGTDLRRHTPLTTGDGEGEGFYARQAVTDGTRVVYTCAGELWLLDNLDGAEPHRLDIRLGGQRIDLQPHPVRAAHHLGDARPDHAGRGSAVEVRGSIHWVTHREGPARALAAHSGVRARLPRVHRVNGEEHVVWVTDAEGDDALEFAPATGTATGATPRRLAAGRLGRVLDLAVAPDGSRTAVASHDGRVILVERATGEVRDVDRSDHGAAEGLVFSPDSAWLAWSQPGPGPLRQLKLANTSDLTVAEATPLRFNDFSPAFTVDGKYLVFLSERAFDPVYDAHVFDLAFVGACRPHLITLAAATPSPFGPQLHGRPADPVRSEQEADRDGDSETVPATRIDLDGIADRIVPFPVEAARYSALQAAEGGVLWLCHPVCGVLGSALAAPGAPGPATSLERYDFAQLRILELVDDLDDFAVSGDGKRVLITADGGLRLIPSTGKPSDGESDTNIAVDLSRVRLTIDPAAEWQQMYAEAGRLMRDNFWRPDLSGTDWDAVLDRYRPVLARVATHDDLVDLLWEVQGELGTSHAYVTPPGGYSDPTRRQGLLGADISRSEDGIWRIDRILPSETSDPQARSPLAAPGVAIRAGDAILAVDGRPVEPVTGPGPLLVGAADKPVELTIGPVGGGNPRHTVVVPVADEEPLRYHAWVADRRTYVHEQSGGRLGYLHVPDMVGSGWAQLHRDLRVEVACEGLVVDVRENRGGHTSQLVVEKLARRIIGWDVPRGMKPFSYPMNAPRGPVVVVADEFSGSDGDIVNAAIKALGIGPVVGTRTWGGVIGIDSRYRLVDGTSVTQPKYAFWLEGHGWNMENHGVDPDVEVVHTPQDWAAGRDRQLDEAIRIALAALVEHPAKTPPELPWTDRQ